MTVLLLKKIKKYFATNKNVNLLGPANGKPRLVMGPKLPPGLGMGGNPNCPDAAADDRKLP